MPEGLEASMTKRHRAAGLIRSAVGVLVVSACVSACGHTSIDRQLDDMAWLEGADPVAMLRDSLPTHSLHFLAVCGVSCVTPGIGFMTYEQCYKGAADVRTIDPTGDVIGSERQEHLKELAARFAGRYNRLLVKALDARGERSCPEGEQWDSLWTALNNIAKQLPQEPNASFVMALRDNAAQFQLHVQKARYLTPALYERLCRAAPAHGIHRQLVIRVSSGNINDHPEMHESIRCKDGKLLE